MYSAVITKSGQVTLPKELRDFLGVKPGERIFFRKSKDEISVRRRMSDEEFTRQLDAIGRKYSSSRKNMPDAVEAVRAFREGKITTINKHYEEKFA